MKPPCDEGVMRSPGALAWSGARSPAGRWVLAATILGSSMAFIDGTVVNVAVPALQETFHASVVDVQWVVESYGIFLSALILAGGALGDLFGRRRIFLVGVAVFAAASAACGFASSIQQLVVARCVQGIAAAMLVPGSLAIISASFDQDSRGKAIGIWSGFTAITTALGPLLGGWLVEYASWRWAFFLNVFLAVPVLAISLRHVPESCGSQARRVDWLGAILATAGLAGVTTAFLESGRLGWRNPLVLCGFAVGLVLLVLFLAVEARLSSAKSARAPMVPLGLFRSRSFAGANLLTLLLYATIGVFFFLFPMNLIEVQRYSATAAGSAMLPIISVMFLLSRWSGGLVRRYGARTPLIIGPLIVAAGFLLFAAVVSGGAYWKTYLPASLVLGLGMAVTVAPLTTVVMSSVDQRHAGAASGINNAVARVAGVLAIAVFGMVVMSLFATRVERTLTKLSLPPGAVQEIRARESELAGLEPPPNLDRRASASLQEAISEGFVSGFRVVLLCCAALSVGSAAVARRWIAGNGPEKNKREAVRGYGSVPQP